MKTRVNGRRGYVMLSVAFLALLFLGFLGLAIDLGYFFYVRRQMQKATDAAAIGGEHEIELGQPALVVTAGWNDASLNGFSNDKNNVTVTIHNPPTSGPYTGQNSAVEAIIQQPVPTLFMKAFGIGAVPVSTRAVAVLGSSSACIFALDPSASGAITVAGTPVVTSSCGVIDDSSSSSALQVNGTSASLSASSVLVTGNWSGTGSVTCQTSPCPAVNQPPAPDPLAYLTEPTPSSCTYTDPPATPPSYIAAPGTYTLSPGVYCGGLVINSQSIVNFNPGLYVLAGGTAVTGGSCPPPQTSCTVALSVTGGATLSGTDVTFYITGPIGSPSSCDETYIAGTTNVNLAAPTTGGNYGPYDQGGILFFQDRNCNAPAVIKGTTTTGEVGYQGALYFAGANLTYSGTSNTSAYSIVVADTLSFLGTPYFNNDYSSVPAGSPVKGVVLGE
jgi:Putative Flp pilus-assembly TadE/G-like